jgi:hypothetical protein
MTNDVLTKPAPSTLNPHLRQIARILNRNEWYSGTCFEIAQVLREIGFQIEEPV